ncbi:DUF397 domain-containing protein [Actinoallomurus spadix]|nr:DUF397 domain-containing protein [Actinoallomurus spadix]MCO5987264.1 DUF397 domain-containing protein [Actinoallomurus spadix]
MREWRKATYSGTGDSNCVEVTEWSDGADQS